MLIGAAAQFGIFGAYAIALAMGFDPSQAGAIGIIGGADGPTAIFLRRNCPAATCQFDAGQDRALDDELEPIMAHVQPKTERADD